MQNSRYCKVVDSGSYRFHYHKARIYWYLYEDGSKQTEFWSYYTPIIVKIGNDIWLNENRYSMTTSRQKYRFARELGINLKDAEIVDERTMRLMCR